MIGAKFMRPSRGSNVTQNWWKNGIPSTTVWSKIFPWLLNASSHCVSSCWNSFIRYSFQNGLAIQKPVGSSVLKKYFELLKWQCRQNLFYFVKLGYYFGWNMYETNEHTNEAWRFWFCYFLIKYFSKLEKRRN